jgi:hypothetical protein
LNGQLTGGNWFFINYGTIPHTGSLRSCLGDCRTITGIPAPADYFNARQLLEDAISSGLLPRAYCRSRLRDRYEALNYDIYDFSLDMALVQQRNTEKSKYLSILKSYMIISRDSVKGLTVEEVKYAKYLVIRTAKATKLNFGLVLDRVIDCREARRMAALKRR